LIQALDMSKKRLGWPTRPFASAHWSLLVSLLVVWEFGFIFDPCRESPFYFECGLTISTIYIALWVNHVRVAPIQRRSGVLQIVGGAIYDLLSFMLLLILITIPFAMIMPTYHCYTPRTKVAEMMVSTSPLRATIGERALAKNSLEDVGEGMKIVPSGRVKGGVVTRDGLIILASDEPPAVVIFTPEFQDSEVQWKCIGFPTKYMPLRDSLNNSPT
jgi:Tfp pilus assembly major pilin PilA